MDQDTLRFLLREAVRETVTEVLQTVLELDRTAFLQAHGGRRNGLLPPQAGDHLRPGGPEGP
jgi:putative transposase